MKIIVGMSGGVDSSVAALLLQKQGYEVEALFMRNWDSTVNNDFEGNPDLNNDICPQEQDYNDAKDVCDKLGIKLHRVDFVKEYWNHVFTYFLDELKKGRTPNPDIMCNKYIKFDYFLKKAKDLGAEKIATGHYAKIQDGLLKKAKDTNKDQTYFLSFLSKDQLKDVLFPLGDLTKDEIRNIALENDLSVAKKKDSTGICFIGERNFSKFLTNYLSNKEGNIIDIQTNKKLGTHIGLMHYTIGQRKNLGLGGAANKIYVCGKDIDKNILYVAEGGSEEYLISTSCIIEDINDLDIKDNSEYNAKFRYRSKDIKVKINKLEDDNILVSYDMAKSITPGQVCALYNDNNILIGAGIIKTIQKDNKKLWYL